MTPAAILLLMALGPTAAAGAETTPTSPQPPRWERYQKVVQFNIFVRERGVREARVRRDDATKPAAAAMPAPHLILRGVSRRRDAWVAFVEDIRTGQVTQVAPDDEVGGGRVEAISMDALTYRYGEATVDIRVGSMIGSTQQTADTAPAPSAAATSATDTTDSPGTASGTPTAGESAILERLRKKRQAQLGKSAPP